MSPYIEIFIGLMVIFGAIIYRLVRKERKLRERISKPFVIPETPELEYGCPGSPVMGHVRFCIDRMDRSNTFLELDGQRLRFFELSIESSPCDMPIVRVSIFARIIEGEIRRSRGTVEVIHIDESTKGLFREGEQVIRKEWSPPPADGGCPAGVAKE